MLGTWPRRRLLIALLAGVLLSTLLLLGANLSQLNFRSGVFLGLGPGEEVPQEPVKGINLDWFWEGLMWALLAFLPFSIIAAFIWPQSFRMALLRALALSAVLLLTYYFIRTFKDLIERLLEALRRFTQAAAADESPALANRIAPGAVQAPHWMIFPTLLGLLTLFAFLIWWAIRYARAGPEEAVETELPGLAALAGAAAADLRAGKELKDTVMRCYREMSELLAERKHIPPAKRPILTPREFEGKLRELGVRDEHVHKLTELFEHVRYGRYRASQLEEREAERALAEIERVYGKPGVETPR